MAYTTKTEEYLRRGGGTNGEIDVFLFLQHI